MIITILKGNKKLLALHEKKYSIELLTPAQQ